MLVIFNHVIAVVGGLTYQIGETAPTQRLGACLAVIGISGLLASIAVRIGRH